MFRLTSVSNSVLNLVAASVWLRHWMYFYERWPISWLTASTNTSYLLSHTECDWDSVHAYELPPLQLSRGTVPSCPPPLSLRPWLRVYVPLRNVIRYYVTYLSVSQNHSDAIWIFDCLSSAVCYFGVYFFCKKKVILKLHLTIKKG